MGDRISVIVPLDQKPGDYAIRMSSLAPEQIIQGLSILRYSGQPDLRDKHNVMLTPSSRPHIDLVGDMISTGTMMDELTDLAPFPDRRPPESSDTTLRFMANMTTPSTWVLASEPHQGFRQQMPPILWNKESHGPTTFSGLKNGSVVDIIYENAAHAMHPFHKHNHKAFIIGRGEGYFKWPDVATALKEAPESFNMIDPPLRDGARLAAGPGSWTVIRYTITFPALKGGDAMPPAPDYIKNLTHSEFVPPLRYGPLD
ncbi:hypothetical protein N0V90_004028 [Kalmusia sp. IMI 367209]|nr:hypothetical protein N0V90_004028 [Kalmusia sp. IMI 367209]